MTQIGKKRQQTKTQMCGLQITEEERKSGGAEEGSVLMTPGETYTRATESAMRRRRGEEDCVLSQIIALPPSPAIKNVTLKRRKKKSKLFTKRIHGAVYSPVVILLLDACQVSSRPF